jgi:hypothetical protein
MRLRLRLRTHLWFVGLVALSLGLVIGMERRRASLLHLARYHRMASINRGFVADWVRGGRIYEFLNVREIDEIAAEMGVKRHRVPDRDIARMLDAASTFHFDLMRKYHRAWTRPWLAVACDPPAPRFAYPSVPAVGNIFDDPDGF